MQNRGNAIGVAKSKKHRMPLAEVRGRNGKFQRAGIGERARCLHLARAGRGTQFRYVQCSRRTPVTEAGAPVQGQLSGKKGRGCDHIHIETRFQVGRRSAPMEVERARAIRGQVHSLERPGRRGQSRRQ